MLPPPDLHIGVDVPAKRTETALALLSEGEGKENAFRNNRTLERGPADLRKYARITRNLEVIRSTATMARAADLPA